MKKIILPVAIIFVSLLLVFFQQTGNDDPGYNYSTSTYHYQKVPVLQIVSYEERGCTVRCGSTEVVQGFQNGAWRDVTTVRRNNRFQIPANQIILRNEHFGYFWISRKFGVTTDGGATWTLWDAEHDPRMKGAVDENLIESVEIDDEGRGRMSFSATGRNRSGISHLETEDFGNTWHEKL